MTSESVPRRGEGVYRGEVGWQAEVDRIAARRGLPPAALVRAFEELLEPAALLTDDEARFLAEDGGVPVAVSMSAERQREALAEREQTRDEE